MWQTPKTNWARYDYFNVADWDRIRGNLEYLRDFAIMFFDTFTLQSTNSKTVTDWLYASDLNAIESNLETINIKTQYLDIGLTKTFTPGGSSIDYIELNRIERACVTIYQMLSGFVDKYYFCDNELYADEAVGLI